MRQARPDSCSSNSFTICLKKNVSHAMGMTLRKDKEDRCIIGRIMIGGLIHRQGGLHVGDEIIEINGESVVGDSLEFIQKLLKTAHGTVYITVTPNYWRDPQNCEIYVRAMFDYNPSEDPVLPASQIGLSFVVGDILRVISKDDNSWWQAQHLDSDVDSPARLVPSCELQESRAIWRLSDTQCGGASANHVTNESPLHHQQTNCHSLITSSCNPFLLRQRCRRKRNRHKNLCNKHSLQLATNNTRLCNGQVNQLNGHGPLQHPLQQDPSTSTSSNPSRVGCAASRGLPGNCAGPANPRQPLLATSDPHRMHLLLSDLDFTPYEEVVEVAEHYRKTLILLGAHGVGRRHIKNCLVQTYPHLFGAPVPHTSKPPEPNQINGKDYFFASQEEMLSDIANNLFLEYGRQGDVLYGIKMETVRRIVACKLIPVLDVEPQTLRLLRNGEFSPFVVFISPPDLELMSESAREISDGSIERLSEESELLEALYRPFIDMEVINYSIEETIEPIVDAINELHTNPQWIPVTWIY